MGKIDDNDNGKMIHFIEIAWNFFISMKGGIILLLVTTGVSFYGSLLPYEHAMDRVYTSWWFVATLVLLGLNLLFCNLQRWKSIWKKATVLRDGLSYKTLNSYPEKKLLALSGLPEEQAGKISKFLLKKGYRVNMVMHDQGFLVSGDKGRFGYFGSLVTHFSILLLLIAAFYGIIRGYEDFDRGFPGRVLPVEKEDFQVRIDDFYISYRDDEQRSIEQYYSELTVIEDGREVKQQTIYVNKPLRHRGVNFYQSTYGWGVEASLVNTATGKEEKRFLLPGQVFHLGMSGLHLHLIEFFPDFAMTAEGIPYSHSAYPANPFVAFYFTGPHGLTGRPFQLARINEPLELDGEHVLQFTAYQNYTGLLISSNPGKPFALTASILMIAGLVMSFYFFPRRVWAYLGEETEGKVLLSGQSYRNKVGFEVEFNRLTDELKTRLGE